MGCSTSELSHSSSMGEGLTMLSGKDLEVCITRIRRSSEELRFLPAHSCPLSWMEAVDTTRKLGGDAGLVSLSREDTEDPLGLAASGAWE